MTKVRICGECSKQLTGYNQKKYCSSKCAATYNNKHFVKRKRTYGTCVGCGTQTYPRRTKYCNNCKHMCNINSVSGFRRYQKYDYSYTSNNSPVSRNHFKSVAKKLSKLTNIKKNEVIVELQ